MQRCVSLLLLIFAIPAFVRAQHEHTLPKRDTLRPAPQMEMTDTIITTQHPQVTGNMGHAFSLHLPMTRNGSGTGWLPDASPMYGKMYHTAKWMYMLHGNLFGRYNNQDFNGEGSRGGKEFDAPNWLMFMGQRQVGQKGLLHFGSMLSFDALTGGNSGYPLLFQSGEAYRGHPLVDRQHPHDLFSELSVSFAYAFSAKTDVFLYLAYPGEPALGPVAFMHRPSALYNPDAPLSHHWIDATHVTFGVATLGLRMGKFKVEGSSFTGREPDEHRYDFDRPRMDSYSGRLSFNPSKNWAMQLSHGYLHSPEALHPAENIYRTTASATYSLPISGGGWFNAVGVWGMNKVKGDKEENAFSVEAAWTKRKTTLYGRYEYVQKSSEELQLDELLYGSDALYAVNALTLGFQYDLAKWYGARLAAGSQFTVYDAQSQLDALYGDRPMAFEVYLRIYPDLMKM